MLRFLSPLATSLLLVSGCSSLAVMSHVPLSTMSRLSAMSLSEVDPRALRVAARMPEIIEPRRDGVKVTIAIGADSRSKLELVLEPAGEPSEMAALLKYAQPGMRIWVYRPSAADAARLQEAIASAGAAGQANVSIAAGVDACRRGPLASQPLPTTTLLRTAADGYMLLAEDLDLRSVVDERELAAKVPPCG